jgi:glycosyltransferase involved in cell wall biosynthesis
MPKLLAIAPTYYPHMGGAERAFHELYTRLPKIGWEVTLITPYLGGEREETPVKGFKVYRVGNKQKNRIAKFFSYQKAEWNQIKKLSKAEKFDIIHCQYIVPNGYVACKASKLYGVPLVFSLLHFGTGMDISSPKQNPIILNPYMKWLLKKATCITTIGLTQSNFLKWLCKKLPKNTSTIKLGSPKLNVPSKEKKDSLKKKWKLQNKKVIFSIGRLTYRKRFDELLKMAQYLDKNTQILIAGKGDELEKLKQFAKDLKLKNVTFLGFVSDKEREELFQLADVFAYTSEFEGSGIVYTEAMSYGCPVVAYQNEAVSDIITTGKEGIITPRNPKKLAEEINNVLANDIKTTLLAKNAENLIKTIYNWDKYAARHATLFNTIVKEKN